MASSRAAARRGQGEAEGVSEGAAGEVETAAFMGRGVGGGAMAGEDPSFKMPSKSGLEGKLFVKWLARGGWRDGQRRVGGRSGV